MKFCKIIIILFFLLFSNLSQAYEMKENKDFKFLANFKTINNETFLLYLHKEVRILDNDITLIKVIIENDIVDINNIKFRMEDFELNCSKMQFKRLDSKTEKFDSEFKYIRDEIYGANTTWTKFSIGSLIDVFAKEVCKNF